MNEIPGDGGSGLTVSVGGTTIVSTDVVLVAAEMLRFTAGQAEDFRMRLNNIRELDAPGADWRWTPRDAGLPLLWASAALGRMQQRSGDVSAALVLAAELYGWAESSALRLAVLGSAKVGHDIGTLLRLSFFIWPAPLALGVATALGLFTRAASSGLGKSAAGKGLVVDQRFLTDPRTVMLARLLVSSLDDVALGALGMPLGLDLLLGDTGLGVTGVSSTALLVLASARAQGLFREGPVTVKPVSLVPSVVPPTGVADLAKRIPKAVPGQPQVRIEKYVDGGQASWAVYVGGTVDWEAVATTEPWDLTANVAAMAQENAGSFDAVMEAMQAAGIQTDDPVVVVGHSQGGLVATQVAATGAYDVQAVATFGAPETAVPVPSGVATLTVEHKDDIITAAGGASMVYSDDRVTVRREVFATTDPPADTALPAHHLDTYRETALLIDASPEANLQGFRDTVTGLLGSAPGEAVLWRGVRLPGGPAQE
ncbi:hypothetical protein E3T39_03440 [Cryobacterium suzukii]|uniref:DUF1023 domain-containing protein n=1 Tax=Cryobacterium suzukii TaxID=1259198 RepID=A0A4R9AHF0_9MICO|nr:alpha/beta hydrolase [Cryobacterium suzukii]TFD62076.1 hypothetical protein E3T39_03440 [Cryobacterium suzukii]